MSRRPLVLSLLLAVSLATAALAATDVAHVPVELRARLTALAPAEVMTTPALPARARLSALLAAPRGAQLVTGVAASAPADHLARLVAPAPADLAAHVAALTAPEMEGRGSGTPGGDRAARYIADRLAAAGLAPGGESGGFFQLFGVGAATRAGAGAAIESLGPAAVTLDLSRDWTPHGGSATGEASGEIVFVGRGASSAGGPDDYGGVDVAGKIALALGGGTASRIEQLLAARRHGAAALLIAGDELPSLDATAAPVRLLSAAITRSAADRLLAPGATSLEALASLDRFRDEPRHQPRAVPTGVRARIRISLERENRRAANVVGILPGTDPALAGQVVVLGAHYDHLGRAGGVVHPGADDNASGTAVVLELARAFAAAGGAPRTLVFALFGGEELGLRGSIHYTSHPARPLAQTVAMLNFDMVGRMRGDRLFVSGMESGSGLRALVTAAGAGAELVLRDEPFAPSDHASFYTSGVPVLFFHTGEHEDYHRPSDTADKINAAGMAEVARVALRVADRLAREPRPAYAKVARPAAGPREGGAGGGAFLGVSVDGRWESDGVRLGSVISGSAAARAGLREGDVIVRLDDVALGSFADLRRVLAAKHPGDLVTVTYLRDGEDHRASTALGTRP